MQGAQPGQSSPPCLNEPGSRKGRERKGWSALSPHGPQGVTGCPQQGPQCCQSQCTEMCQLWWFRVPCLLYPHPCALQKLLLSLGVPRVVKSSLWGECCCRLDPKSRCHKHTWCHPSLQLCSASTKPPWHGENPSLIQRHLHIHQCKAVNYQGLLWVFAALGWHWQCTTSPTALPCPCQELWVFCKACGGSWEEQRSCPPAPEESENLPA